MGWKICITIITFEKDKVKILVLSSSFSICTLLCGTWFVQGLIIDVKKFRFSLLLLLSIQTCMNLLRISCFLRNCQFQVLWFDCDSIGVECEGLSWSVSKLIKRNIYREIVKVIRGRIFSSAGYELAPS